MTALNDGNSQSLIKVVKEIWSHWRESNPRPLDYESRAIPLSHSGITGAIGIEDLNVISGNG